MCTMFLSTYMNYWISNNLKRLNSRHISGLIIALPPFSVGRNSRYILSGNAKHQHLFSGVLMGKSDHWGPGCLPGKQCLVSSFQLKCDCYFLMLYKWWKESFHEMEHDSHLGGLWWIEVSAHWQCVSLH